MDFDNLEDLFIGETTDSSPREIMPSHDETLFLIDCSPEMFAEYKESRPFYMVIQAAIAFYKDKILAAEQDSIGILLFNTEVAENHMTFPAVHVL